MISIVLYNPEIPANTGNVARTCAVTGMPLYLVRPLGFEITESRLRRAGLDYWDKVNVTEVDDFASLTKEFGEQKFYYFTSHADKIYTDVSFPSDAFLVFGKETKGLPPELVAAHRDRALRLPMRDNLRCLNLSNSVAIAAYEALRQHEFFGYR